MKSFKLLPLLLTTTMLTACNLFGGSKEVKAKSYSNKVEYADWKEARDNADGSGEESSETQSLEAKIELYATDTIEANKLGAKTSQKTKVSGQISSRYDKDNNLGLIKANLSQTMDYKNVNTSLSGTNKYNYERNVQSEKIDGEDKVVTVDKKNKLYFVQTVNSVPTVTLGNVIKTVLGPSMMSATYESLTEEQAEEKAKYSFYVDSDVFTIVYESSETYEPKTTIDGEEVVAYTEETTKKITAQYEFKSEKEISVTYITESQIDTSYKIDSNTYKVGDHQTQEEVTCMKTTIVVKDVELKRVNIGTFDEGKNDIEIDFD